MRIGAEESVLPGPGHPGSATRLVPMKVLLLGGTAEARSLADTLWVEQVRFVSSLAGRVSQPRLPVGQVRTGGFGGVAGLVRHLREESITHVVDATHPFATTMTQHAAQAGRLAGVPVLRLSRPGWGSHPLASTWTWVDDYEQARSAADDLGRRPFLTTGRQTLTHFREWIGRDVVVRVVEPLEDEPPARWRVLHDRGPFDVGAELALMRRHGVNVLLTKDSGGTFTQAKLSAAHCLGVPTVVVRRPQLPPATTEVSDVASVRAWLRAG